MSVWFIAGAGTDIGKTYVTSSLIRQLRGAGRLVQALKPVASGVAPLDAPGFHDSDTAVLLDALGLPLTAQTVDECSPWRFSAPLSPDMAAAAEERRLPFADVLGWCRSRVERAHTGAATLVEGAGGVMSPIAEDALNLDLIKGLACPVILVGGTYLGGLSHIMTALETLKAHRVPTHAVILNESKSSTVDFGASLSTLRRFAAHDTIVPLLQGGELTQVDLQ